MISSSSSSSSLNLNSLSSSLSTNSYNNYVDGLDPSDDDFFTEDDLEKDDYLLYADVGESGYSLDENNDDDDDDHINKKRFDIMGQSYMKIGDNSNNQFHLNMDIKKNEDKYSECNVPYINLTQFLLGDYVPEGYDNENRFFSLFIREIYDVEGLCTIMNSPEFKKSNKAKHIKIFYFGFDFKFKKRSEDLIKSETKKFLEMLNFVKPFFVFFNKEKVPHLEIPMYMKYNMILNYVRRFEFFHIDDV